MQVELADRVRDYLAALGGTQSELAEVGTRKRLALRKANAEALLQLAAVEERLVARLRGHVVDRERLLEDARARGLAVQSISELVGRLPEEGRRLRQRLDAARQTTARLRRETWVHWIVARNAATHYGELLEVIAHRGQRPPTYASPSHAGPARDGGPSGGALLDTEV